MLFERSAIKNYSQPFINYNCDLCCLDTVNKIEPVGNKNSGVYVLTDKPFFTKKGTTLTEADFLNAAFNKIFISSNFRFNSIVMCSSSKKALTDFERNCCKQNVLNDINAVNPFVIIAVGEDVLNYLTGFEDIHLWRGRKLHYNLEQSICYVVPVYHPSFLTDFKKSINFEDVFNVLMHDLKLVKEVLDKKERPQKITINYDNVFLLKDKTAASLEILLNYFKKIFTYKEISVDIETNTLDVFSYKEKIAKLLSMSFSCKDFTFTFSYQHSDFWSEQELKKVNSLIINFFNSYQGKIIVHNLTFEVNWFCKFFKIKTVLSKLTNFQDTIAYLYILDERTNKKKGGPFALDTALKTHLGINLKAFSNIDASDLENYNLNDVLKYNSLDSKYTLLLYYKLKELLIELNLLKQAETASQTAAVITAASFEGFLIDLDTVEQHKHLLLEKIKEQEKIIESLEEIQEYKKNTNEVFNYSSTVQLRKIYDEKGYETSNTTAKGFMSVDKNTLSEFAEKYNDTLAKTILKVRRYKTLSTTFVEPIEDFLDKHNFIHTQYNPFFTRTGRLSSKKPNLQNFPKRSDVFIRESFKAEPHTIIVACDYGQIEARIIALAAGDMNLLNAIWNGYDIHLEWAKECSDMHYNSVEQLIIEPFFKENKNSNKELTDEIILKKYRSIVKNKLVFPLFYGASVKRCSTELAIPHEKMEIIVNKFWKNFIGVKAWQQLLLDYYEENGFVTTLTGRKRHAPLTTTQIYNTPIQGTASDLVTTTANKLVKLAVELDKPQLLFRLNVHDDLTFMLPIFTFEEDLQIIAKQMCCSDLPFLIHKIPLTIEVSIGENWGELEHYKNFDSFVDFGIDRKY